MAILAKYAIDTYGINGIIKYNSICCDLWCAKAKSLDVLKSEVDLA
jgi:hypothetical protein